jgi:RNA-directed DNA polymerase
MKNILEPIFEADFYPTSYGFRPGKSVHAALEHLRMLLRPQEAGPEAQRRLPYQWAIEGDIKGCFDNIDHHALMVRIRRRIGDPKVTRLVLAFLKAGVMSETQFVRTEAGTPQGGILSPLLANIALQAIDERYARHVRPAPTVRTKRRDPASTEGRARANRSSDRRRGLDVLMPIRYADDFIILVSVKPARGSTTVDGSARYARKPSWHPISRNNGAWSCPRRSRSPASSQPHGASPVAFTQGHGASPFAA